eukprot:TRINITY_DN4624_c0_g1_i1.p1 TRINITY_DN4624_c0_g1~~TRINITY_DN4624_c0_g1_i1.p1  ORF type:complete len:292 (-),score=8.02 TRINITY_DN4624_c0_g1_i1:90-965(-)
MLRLRRAPRLPGIRRRPATRGRMRDQRLQLATARQVRVLSRIVHDMRREREARAQRQAARSAAPVQVSLRRRDIDDRSDSDDSDGGEAAGLGVRAAARAAATSDDDDDYDIDEPAPREAPGQIVRPEGEDDDMLDDMLDHPPPVLERVRITNHTEDRHRQDRRLDRDTDRKKMRSQLWRNIFPFDPAEMSHMQMLDWLVTFPREAEIMNWSDEGKEHLPGLLQGKAHTWWRQHGNPRWSAAHLLTQLGKRFISESVREQLKRKLTHDKFEEVVVCGTMRWYAAWERALLRQ